MNTKSLYLSITIFSAFFCHSSMAEDSQAMTPSRDGKEAFSGLYLTGSLGHSHLGAQKNSRFVTDADGLVVGGGKDVASNACFFSANVGWARFAGPLYLAIEGGALHDGQKAHTSANSVVGPVNLGFKESLVRGNGLELKLKLGALVTNNTLLYGSIGAEQSRFTYHGKVEGYQSKVSKSLAAIVPGVGVKVVLSDRLALDFNYGYSLYQRWTINNLSVDNGRVTAKLHPSVSTARLGISFKL